jgi:hypothetical protein
VGTGAGRAGGLVAEAEEVVKGRENAGDFK